MHQLRHVPGRNGRERAERSGIGRGVDIAGAERGAQAVKQRELFAGWEADAQAGELLPLVARHREAVVARAARVRHDDGAALVREDRARRALAQERAAECAIVRGVAHADGNGPAALVGDIRAERGLFQLDMEVAALACGLHAHERHAGLVQERLEGWDDFGLA